MWLRKNIYSKQSSLSQLAELKLSLINIIFNFLHKVSLKFVQFSIETSLYYQIYVYLGHKGNKYVLYSNSAILNKQCKQIPFRIVMTFAENDELYMI